MSVARPALLVALRSLGLRVSLAACGVSLPAGALLTACGAHPPATMPDRQASPAPEAASGVAAAPVPEASSSVLAAPAPVQPSVAAPEPTAKPAADGLTPLTAEQRATLLAGAEDTLAETPIHYVKSNEVRHDVWFPYIRGVGGAYLGVGSDQNYTVAAAARSELMFLSDIDRSVVDLHRIYEVLIEASDTPEALHARFDRGHEAESAALLDSGFAALPEAERRRLVRLYRNARETVYRHLRHVIKRKRNGEPSSWLSDPTMYDHIRALFLADRVRPMGGDLTGTSSLQTAAAAARALGVPFRVIYFSNAEEYFDYTRSFIANIQAFETDERSVLLRTIYAKDWVHADQLWAYQVQPLADFKRRLGERKNRSRNPMLKYAEFDGTLDRETGTKGLSLIALPVAGG
jgi:hypothetical protein